MRRVKLVRRRGAIEIPTDAFDGTPPTVELELGDNERILDFEWTLGGRPTMSDPFAWVWFATIEISGPST